MHMGRLEMSDPLNSTFQPQSIDSFVANLIGMHCWTGRRSCSINHWQIYSFWICMNIELLLNSASDDDDDETLSISLSIEKEANNNNHNHHCPVSVLSSSGASSLTMPSPNRPMTPMTQGLIIPPPPSSDGIVIKTQRPSTPSTTLDDKDGNDSEGRNFSIFLQIFDRRLIPQWPEKKRQNIISFR